MLTRSPARESLWNKQYVEDILDSLQAAAEGSRGAFVARRLMLPATGPVGPFELLK